MSNIFFFPTPVYVQELKLGSCYSVMELCRRAGIDCLASGEWVNRKVEIIHCKEHRKEHCKAHGNDLVIFAEPGDWGSVRILMKKTTKESEARLALLVLAYSLHDLVAKQSVLGMSWSKVPIPRGRMRTGRALDNSERQRLFRERQA